MALGIYSKLTPSSILRSSSDIGSHSTLKADSLAVFEGTLRDPQGPEGLCNAESADDFVTPTCRLVMGASAANAIPNTITVMTIMAELQLVEVLMAIALLQCTLEWGE